MAARNEAPRVAHFQFEVPASGEQAFVHATVHRGGVVWTMETTNPNFGGLSSIGEQTLDAFVHEAPLRELPEELLAEMRALVDELRAAARADDPNPAAPDGITPLHRAAARNDVAELRRLIALGVDVDERPLGDRPSALERACASLHVEAIDVLLAADAATSSASEIADSSVLALALLAPTARDEEDRMHAVRALVAHGALAALGAAQRARLKELARCNGRERFVPLFEVD